MRFLKSAVRASQAAEVRPHQASLFADETPLPDGVTLLRGRIGVTEAQAMLDAMLGVFDAAPPYRLKIKTGAYVINRMTNCGALGWHSDEKGYRYIDRHPETQMAFPPIPDSVMAAARAAAAACGAPDFMPDACLVNLYGPEGKLNLHQDHDEKDFSHPIVSLSFGHEAVFLAGGRKRKDPVVPVVLSCGDVMIMHGPGRMIFHGVKKILPGTARFAHAAIPAGGRLNLTLRRAA